MSSSILLVSAISGIILILLPIMYLWYISRRIAHRNENYSYSRKKDMALKDFADCTATNSKIKLGKRDNHLYYKRDDGTRKLDLSYFNKPITINIEEGYVHVEGMMRMDKLVEYTLRYDRIPLVVPEFVSLTVGGLVSGVGLESSSFKYGLFHDSVTEYEVLTGNGGIVLANKDTNCDLFQGLPNSYGSIGYILSAKVRIRKALSFVRIQNVRFTDPSEFIGEIRAIERDEEYDFIDGTIFNAREMYLMKAKMIATKPRFTNSYSFDQYYKSVPKLEEDYLTIKDYLWRYDSNCFYLGADGGILDNKYLRHYIKPFLSSDKLKLLSENKLVRKLVVSCRGEGIANDLSLPIDGFLDFLDWYDGEIGVFPVWICPYKTLRDTAFKKSGHYAVDFGVGFGVQKAFDDNHRIDKDYYRKKIDTKMYELKRVKGLYSQTFLTKEQFWELYGPKEDYTALKSKWDAKNMLVSLDDKILGCNS